MAVELSAGNFADALHLADIDLEHAYRVADRSAMILPLVAYAIALRRHDEVETTAIVRGRLPRRMTVMFEDEMAELASWLAAHLDEQHWQDLARHGASMEPRAVRDLARTAIDRHLDPTT
jgi:hypothetical protein